MSNQTHCLYDRSYLLREVEKVFFIKRIVCLENNLFLYKKRKSYWYELFYLMLSQND